MRDLRSEVNILVTLRVFGFARFEFLLYFSIEVPIVKFVPIVWTAYKTKRGASLSLLAVVSGFLLEQHKVASLDFKEVLYKTAFNLFSFSDWFIFILLLFWCCPKNDSVIRAAPPSKENYFFNNYPVLSSGTQSYGGHQHDSPQHDSSDSSLEDDIDLDNITPVRRGGAMLQSRRDFHKKRSWMFVVSRRRVNQGFWSMYFLGCARRNEKSDIF